MRIVTSVHAAGFVHGPLFAVACAVAAAYGAHLLFTAVAFGWRGLGPSPELGAGAPSRRRSARQVLTERLVQAGFVGARPSEVAGLVVAGAALGAGAGFAVFGGPLAAIAAGALGGWLPVTALRNRWEVRRRAAHDAWPRLLEELRIRTSTLGRSVPQGLIEVGRRGPEELRPAFDAARREWLLSTDFERTLAVLKAQLADPTADVVCETLLVAHEVGGGDLDRRLESLITDRIADVASRRDAEARQAGVRFARRFVLFVPAGMALAGLTIGDGRASYATPQGQLAVVAGIAVVASCWAWASAIMRLPEPDRVLAG